jgi:hypothetical protein
MVRETESERKGWEGETGHAVIWDHRPMRRAGVAALAALSFVGALPAGAAAQYPYGPDESPPGANDWSCRPTAAHPEPVVLVHGLGANMAQNWGWMSPRLKAAGYCLFALTYGRTLDNPFPFDQLGGTRPMEESGQVLSDFVDRVLAATGAAKVDIVGHSEGSVMPNYYVKFLGGAAKVDDYIGLTPLWNGTDLLLAGELYAWGSASGVSQSFAAFFAANGCGSCMQFVRGSEFLQKMNSGGGPRVDGVDYTMIMSRYDELVRPYTSGYMAGATNIVVQDVCKTDVSEHVAVAFDRVVLQLFLNALDPAHAVKPACGLLPPLL